LLTLEQALDQFVSGGVNYTSSFSFIIINVDICYNNRKGNRRNLLGQGYGYKSLITDYFIFYTAYTQKYFLKNKIEEIEGL